MEAILAPEEMRDVYVNQARTIRYEFYWKNTAKLHIYVFYAKCGAIILFDHVYRHNTVRCNTSIYVKP